MAPRKRQVQGTDAANGKSSPIKGVSKHKLVPKSRSGDEDSSKKNATSVWYKIGIVFLAFIIGYTHRNHIANMFERDRHFSHLSTLERELAFRTEMGLYYSYYKTMIESPTFLEGLDQVMSDNITEFPLTINTLKRFNLYPEVVLAVGFRIYEGVNRALQRPTKMCWNVNRGQGLSPVQSCEGLGEPSYFYVEHVFFLNGLMMSALFLFGTYLSGSLFGGVLTVASFFFNHGEATRVQWTPPLRESFAYPFLVLQMFLVTHLLRSQKCSYIHSVFIAMSTVMFMLPWQLIAVFATYVLGYIGSRKMKVFLMGLWGGFLVSYVLLFGNAMLLTSFFFSGMFIITLIVLLEPAIEALRIPPLIWIVQGGMLAVGTLGIKFAVAKLFNIADDNFHTMLYTCAAEFDFMEAELLSAEYTRWTNRSEADIYIRKQTNRSKPNAEIVYHLFQLAAFTIMAVIIMRLKLFWTPHLCLMTSLLASRQFFGWLGSRERHYAMLAILVACMGIQGYSNLQTQWNIRGEFSNAPLEEMVEWIKAKTTKNAVFAGPMPTMATVKLERTKKVYMMYSRKPVYEVKKTIQDMGKDAVWQKSGTSKMKPTRAKPQHALFSAIILNPISRKCSKIMCIKS
ncbi:D19L1-like protein [Mya arenaria]|uniref:D19L1-like protein n=1 Tax=Mya arenaria TaxID=6604 RepID=A0ABY7DDF4_MYAAR|nr:D19L1-like protein [Mya arenaria]